MSASDEAIVVENPEADKGTWHKELPSQGEIIVGYYEGVVGHNFSGYIEPADQSWIIFLDAQGRPEVYWNARTETGAVIGDPVLLKQ